MKPYVNKKISLLPNIKKFKQNLNNGKYKVKENSSVPQKSLKRTNDKPLFHQAKKRKNVDSTLLREQTEDLVIGSNAQRTNLPLPSADENDNIFFIDDICKNCNQNFLSKPAKTNHVNIYRKKKDITHIPISVFDKNKHMTIICMDKECCLNFQTINAYHSHLENQHNQLPTDTLPIFQSRDMKTYTELTCRLCRGEFTKKANLTHHQKTCTGFQLFFCDLCNFTSSKFHDVIMHGKKKHQIDNDFHILDEFIKKENIKQEKNKAGEINQKSKINLRNLSTIYKTYTKVFHDEYTSMIEALSRENLNKIYKILKNTKAQKEEFRFALCTPVIISKTTEFGNEFRLRYFRTKNIIATSNKSIKSALIGSKNSLLLQGEHLEEMGSGWSVQHTRRLDLIITAVNGVSLQLFYFVKYFSV